MLREKKQMSGYLLSFLLGCLVCLGLLAPFLVVDKGFFLYCGDFNSQQIPFYTYAQSVFKSGDFGWSWISDLGGSFINSYSFYLTGSPFFWLTCLFPTRWVPYLMAPLLMLKFGVASLGAYTFLRRYSAGRNWAIFGALLYAFSGFSVYDIFFNHFMDVVALFPFMLAALDCFVYEKKRGFFALTVAINLLNSYFFFIGQVVFLFLYFFIKLFSRDYRLTVKEFLCLAFEAVLGCFMGVLFAIPALLNLLQNPRSVNPASGFGFWLYSRVQQYFAIVASAFFPPDPPYLPNMFTDCTIKWTSLSAYLPLISFSGVIAYLKSGKKDWIRRILIACMVMALVPVLNSAYYAFNMSYYARWYYMPVLMMALASMRAVQSEQFPLKKAVVITGGILCLFLVIPFTPKKTDDVWSIGLAQSSAKFWLTFCTAMLGLVLFYLLLTQRKEKNRFSARLIGAVMAFTILYGVIHLSLGKFPQWENDADYKQMTYDAAASFTLNDDSFYRVDAYKAHDNIGLHLQVPCIQFFNSVVTPSIMEFYPSVGVKRDVSSKPALENYALRGLLSVKYLLTEPSNVADLINTNQLYGFRYRDESAGYAVLENENYVPMGFTYAYYVTPEQLESVPSANRANVLMRAICLSPEQISLYGGLLQPLATAELSRLSYDRYVADCADRRAESASSFEADETGFTASITLEKENLVFFSVPYDEGFTATVNGERAAVEKVSNGMCAVLAPAGQNTIVFSYHTPGLLISEIMTIGGWAVWFFYVGALIYFKKRETPQKTVCLEGKEI